MTRTQLIVERNKRRKEIRSKLRCAAVISIFIAVGTIPFCMKMQQLITEESMEVTDDTYIKVYFETE